MAMGLASMNPIPGAVKSNVILIKPRDEDKPKYGVTNDFSSNHYVALDSHNKPEGRSLKELDECAVDVYLVKDELATDIFNSLVEMVIHPETAKPLKGNLYEIFANHPQFTDDQPDYDPLLERVYMDKIEKTFEGIQKEVDSIKKHDRTMTSHKLNLDPMITDRGDMDSEGLCFPILASANIEEIDRRFNAIINGEDDISV
jgi:hypothetical protein